MEHNLRVVLRNMEEFTTRCWE